ncbi:MAG: hypothetical protein ACHRXM_29825 [Isosphaerales bacterium]
MNEQRFAECLTFQCQRRFADLVAGGFLCPIRAIKQMQGSVHHNGTGGFDAEVVPAVRNRQQQRRGANLPVLPAIDRKRVSDPRRQLLRIELLAELRLPKR